VTPPSHSRVFPRVVRAAAALGVAAALGLSYLLFESQWLRPVERELEVPGLPPDLEGFTVAQLSDLHVGFVPSFNLRTLRKAVAALDAARPDLIVVTGDLVTGSLRLEALRAELSRLRAPCGVFAVLGNHDHAEAKFVPLRPPSPQQLGRLSADAGVRLLTNECVTVPVGEAAVQVCGVDDVRHGFGDLAPVEASLDRRQVVFRLLLSHFGEVAGRVAPGDFALVLSGDTHGGQICLPWFGGRVMLSSPRAEFREGFHRRDGALVYVTRGVGTSFLPFRFLCRPEIVLFRLGAAR